MSTMPCFGLKGLSGECPGEIAESQFCDVSADAMLQCRECGCCKPASVYQRAARVDLTPEEMLYAEEIGKLRNRDAKRLKLPDKHGFKGQGDDIHVLGARAELAFARFCGVPWEASNLVFKAPDVGPIQVRGRSLLGYDLIIREDDDSTQPFVLVVGRNPFYIMGWTTKELASSLPMSEYGGREAAWFVRHRYLRDPRDLIEMARGAHVQDRANRRTVRR